MAKEKEKSTPEMPRFLLSDESINSYGFIVSTEGIDLSRFLNNPIMLYNHGEAVGKWVNIEKVDGKLYGTPEFYPMETEELARKLEARVLNDFLKGVSIGLDWPTKTEYNEDGVAIIHAQLMEASVCDIPANENALRMYGEKGELLQGEAIKLAFQKPQDPEQNEKIIDMKLSKEALAKLGLNESATDAEVNAAITASAEAATKAQNELAAQNTAKVESLVSTALSAGKIKADEKQHYTDLATANYELAANTIEKLPGLKKLPETPAGNPKTTLTTEGREDWNFTKWNLEDRPGLLLMREQDPEAYQNLLNTRTNHTR